MDKMNAAGEERILDLIIDKIEQVQESLNEMKQDIKDDRRQLVIDRAGCSQNHSGRLQKIEDAVNGLDRVMLRNSAYTAGFIAAVFLVLKLTKVL